MTSIEKIKYNRAVPTTLIYKGANCLGKEIVKNLVEQGGFVIVIDELTDENISNFKEFVDSQLFLFLDFVGIDELKNELERLDYIIFIDDIEKDVLEKIGTDFFLKSSNDLNKVLKISLHFKSKFVLASSLKIHQVLLNMQSEENKSSRNMLEYNRAELQRYSESLVKEYIDKANLNARIVRMAELVGEGVPLNIPSELVRLLKLAVNGKKLNLIGDGLQSNYLIAVKDASFGLLKSLFEEKTKGKIYSICYPQEITSLSLAYKITELVEKAGQIVFDNSEENVLLPINFERSSSLTEIGWGPKINLERAISQEIEWVKKHYGMKINETEKTDYIDYEPMKLAPKAPIANRITNKEINIDADKELKLGKGNNTEGFIKKLSEVTKSKSRNSKIVLSDKLLRDKLRDKEIKEHKEFDRTTFSYKFNYWIRTLTIEKVFSYILIFILSFIIYFFLISPVLRSAKNVFEIYQTSNNTTNTIDQTSLETIDRASSSLVTDLSNSNFLFNLFKLNDLHDNLSNNFNVLKEYSENALSVISQYGDVKNYFLSKTIDPSINVDNYPDLKKLSISNDKLIKDTSKISGTRIGEIDTSISKIKGVIEKEYLNPSLKYISFEEATTLFNIYEKNLGYLVLYTSKDSTNKTIVSGYTYFNNQDFSNSKFIGGKFNDTFKLSSDQKAALENLLNKSTLSDSDKSTDTAMLIEYFNQTLSVKIDTIIAIDYDTNSNLLGDSTILVNNVNLDSVNALSSVDKLTDITSKTNLSSKLTQNYLSRSVEWDKLTDYLNLFSSGIDNNTIRLFTIKAF